jgi:hypothetical protein
MAVEIREHVPGCRVDDFIQAGYEVFRSDPAWVAPLEIDIRARLHPDKNPFFQHAEARYFTAHRNGRVVGRITAQVCREHLRKHQDATGYFGFLDTIDDQEVCDALVEAARRWLATRGMQRMRGPISLSMNEEFGLVIDGNEHPPMVMMGHSRAYQGRLAEGAGLAKVKDFYAWRYDVQAIPPRALRAWEQTKTQPEVKIRKLQRKHADREIDIVLSIFNEAWQDNWGWVPMTRAEADKAVQDLKLVMDEEIALVAEIDGKPAAICLAFPNVNEAIRDLNGKLLPLGWAKLLYRLKVKRTKTARLFIMGIRSEYRRNKRYGGLAMAMFVEIAKLGSAVGYEWGELSLTLEDNTLINLGIKAMGGKVYKTYRLYERAIEG